MGTAEQLLNEKDAAAILGWSIKTLQARRQRLQPPTYVKVGRSVRYKAADLAEFVEAGRVQPQA